MQMAILVYLFYMSKYVEFMDTVRTILCIPLTFFWNLMTMRTLARILLLINGSFACTGSWLLFL